MTSNYYLVGLISFLVGFALLKFVLRLIEARNNGEGASEYNGDNAEPEACAWWEILGVREDASLVEIRSAYKALISKYHPDKFANLAPEFQEIANRKAKEINSAYEAAEEQRS